jgi:hypothetical protein
MRHFVLGFVLATTLTGAAHAATPAVNELRKGTSSTTLVFTPLPFLVVRKDLATTHNFYTPNKITQNRTTLMIGKWKIPLGRADKSVPREGEPFQLLHEIDPLVRAQQERARMDAVTIVPTKATK